MVPPESPVALQSGLLPIAKVGQVGVDVAPGAVWARVTAPFALPEVLDKHQLDPDGNLQAAVLEQILHLVHDGLDELVELHQPIGQAVELVVERLVDEHRSLDGLCVQFALQSGGGRRLAVV